jgi:hypothetical protein
MPRADGKSRWQEQMARADGKSRGLRHLINLGMQYNRRNPRIKRIRGKLKRNLQETLPSSAWPQRIKNNAEGNLVN